MSDDELWRCCKCHEVFEPGTGYGDPEMFCTKACYDAYFEALWHIGPARAAMQGQRPGRAS